MEENTSGRNTILIIVGVVVAILAIGLFIFFTQARRTSTTETTQTTQTEASSATITFTDDGVSPDALSVSAGTQVTVRNNSSRDVQFSSDDHPTHQLNREMNLEVLSPGESASYRASNVGTWLFHDHLNERVTGRVIVTN